MAKQVYDILEILKPGGGIISAQTGGGKTSLLAAFFKELVIARVALINKVNDSIRRLKAGGFDTLEYIDINSTVMPVYSNVPIQYKYKGKVYKTQNLDVFKFGLPNDDFKTDRHLPYSIIFVDEAQENEDSRDASQQEKFQRDIDNVLRHGRICVVRASQTCKNIKLQKRDLSVNNFYIHKMRNVYLIKLSWLNIFTQLTKFTRYRFKFKDYGLLWTTWRFFLCDKVDNLEYYEKTIESKKRVWFNSSYFKFRNYGNVFKYYNSFYREYLFYKKGKSEKEITFAEAKFLSINDKTLKKDFDTINKSSSKAKNLFEKQKAAKKKKAKQTEKSKIKKEKDKILERA